MARNFEGAADDNVSSYSSYERATAKDRTDGYIGI